jgi:hypothetical protein
MLSALMFFECIGFSNPASDNKKRDLCFTDFNSFTIIDFKQIPLNLNHFPYSGSVFETNDHFKKNNEYLCFMQNPRYKRYFKNISALQNLSSYNDHFSGNTDKGKDTPDKTSLKPYQKMIIFQNTLTILSHISSISGSYYNLSKQVIMNLFISNVGLAGSIHKTLLTLDTFTLPMENQKSIVQSNIIIC